jgi:hypothetical protein
MLCRQHPLHLHRTVQAAPGLFSQQTDCPRRFWRRGPCEIFGRGRDAADATHCAGTSAVINAGLLGPDSPGAGADLCEAAPGGALRNASKCAHGLCARIEWSTIAPRGVI